MFIYNYIINKIKWLIQWHAWSCIRETVLFKINLQLHILRNQRNGSKGMIPHHQLTILQVHHHTITLIFQDLPVCLQTDMANKPKCHAVIDKIHRCYCACSQSICLETWCVSHILPYLVSDDLKHILDGPVNIYVSSKLKQSSNSSLCFQKTVHFWFWESLSEFGRWMFIETGATAVCYLLFRNPSSGLSVHSSLPKNRNLSSLSELEQVQLTPPHGTPSPPLFFHNTSFFTVCIACLHCSMLHNACMFTEAANNTACAQKLF